MTAQISKVVERLIKGMIEPHLEKVNAYGENQFAYRKGRGSRDLVLLLMLEWLTALNNRQKIAIFSSDVSGAFDKVDTGRLIQKLKYHGLHPRMIELIFSWLQARYANFREVTFADDLNSYRIYNSNAQNSTIGRHVKKCQDEVHEWGREQTR